MIRSAADERRRSGRRSARLIGALALMVMPAAEAAAQDRAPLNLTPDRGQTRSDRYVPAVPGSGTGGIQVDRISGPRFRGPVDGGSSLPLGGDPWKGTDLVTARALLEALPVGAPSPTMGDLMRALLLAPSPDSRQPRAWTPGGGTPRADALDGELAEFLVLRLARLQEAGHIEDAAALAGQVTGADIGARVGNRIQAVAALLDREETEACDLGGRMRLETEDPFWVKLRAYCYLLDGAGPAAELTADILVERGIDAPLFHSLVLALTGRAAVPDEAWQEPLSALAYAMVRRAGLPLPAHAIRTAEPAVLRAIAMDIDPQNPETPTADLDHGAYLLALRAAELSVVTGALEPAALAHAYRQAPHTDAARADPLALVPRLSPPAANALFFQVIERETIPASRIELLAESLALARRTGSGLPVALVYGDVIATVEPDPDLAWAAGELGLAALIADQPGVAYRWRDVLAQRVAQYGNTDASETLRQLNVALAIAAPRSAQGRSASVDMDAWIAAAGGETPVIDPVLLQEDLELLEALGRPLTSFARAWLITRTESGPTFLSSPALASMARAAAANGEVAEAVALAMIMSGREGPAAPSVGRMVDAIRVLVALGLETPARRLALETLLARPETVSPDRPRQTAQTGTAGMAR